VTFYLTYEQVLDINKAIGEGGLARDPGAIQAALGRPQATVFGDDAYTGIWEKAAALIHSLARNHGFVEGNKRTAWVATVAFLTYNGCPTRPDFDQDAALELVLAVAEGFRNDIPEIAESLARIVSAGQA
jgi:death-on-curing protein